MATIEEDYKRPLKEIYESLPEPTRQALDSDISRIWTYFILWLIFIAFSIVAIVSFIEYVLIDESLGERAQRAGSIIPLLAVMGETLFIAKLNKIASVIHPAQLTYEIYKQRRFKPLVNLSLILTFLFILIGAIFSGYGDILYQRYKVDSPQAGTQNKGAQNTGTIATLDFGFVSGSCYFCESFYEYPCSTSGKNYATANACGCPSRPGHSIATQQGAAHTNQ